MEARQPNLLETVVRFHPPQPPRVDACERAWLEWPGGTPRARRSQDEPMEAPGYTNRTSHSHLERMGHDRADRRARDRGRAEGADRGTRAAVATLASLLHRGFAVAATARAARRARTLVRVGAAIALAGTLAACGFQLRGAANFSFTSIHVGAPPALPFTVELKRALAAAGNAKVLDAPQGAEVVLDINGIGDDKSVLSLSPGGRAREFLLVKRVTFSLRGTDGSQWLPQDQITVQRTYLYDDTERLAREIQEQRLLAEMQTDAIAQIVRRLQAAKKP